MNPSAPAAFRMTEPYWRVIILALSAAVILFTLWCLSNGITTIFMHLYYFPIVLLAYRYRWKGCGLATLLALVYLGLVMVFDPGQTDVILGAFYRVLVFVGIAAVIAIISERLVQAQENLGKIQQFEESVITNANVWISVLAADGSTLLVWNNAAEAISGYKKSDVVGKNTVWKQLYPDPAYRKKVTGEIRRIIGQDEFLENFETEIRCADGAMKTIIWNTRRLRDAGGNVNGYIAIGHDISAEKSAESRAAESSRFLGIMIDTLPIPVFFKDINGRYLGCNPPFEEYIGIKRDKLIGKTAYDISPKELADRYTADDNRIFTHPAPQRYETQVQYADGSRHDVIFYKAPFLNRDGSPAGLIGAFLDISERKITERALQESEEKYRAFFSTSRDCVFITTSDGKWVDFNDAAVVLFGYDTRDELKKTEVSRIYANPGDRAAHLGFIRENGSSFEYPVDLRKKDGTVLHTLVTSVARKDAAGNITGFQGSIRDITERRRAEEKLHESEEKFRQFFNNVRDAMFIHATGDKGLLGKFIEVNAAMCERLGYSRDELLSLSPQDIISEAGKAKMSAIAEEIEKKGYAAFESEHRRKDGSIVPVDVSTVIFSLSGTRVAMAIAHDLTKRKKAEEAMRVSNLILSTQQETSPDGILIVDENGKIIDFNRSFVRIMGIPENLIASRDDGPVLNHVVGQVAEPDAFLSRVRYLYEHRDEKSHEEVRLKDGRVLQRYSAPMLGEDNRYFGRVWYFHDITERKRTEEALRESEKKYRTLFENMLEGFAYCQMIYDDEGRPVDWIYLDVNKAFGQLTGLKDITGKHVLEAIPGVREQTSELFDMYGRVASTGRPETFEIDFKPLKMWLKVSAFSPEKGYFVAAFENVTERRRAEEALRESRQILEGILNTIPVRVFWKDKDLTYLGCNIPFARDAGFENPADVIGKDDYSMSWREQAELYRADDRAVIDSGKPKLMIEEPQTTPAGETIYLLTSKMPLLDANGGSIGVLGTYLDITDRKQAEEQILKSQQLFSDIISFLPDPTFVIDKDGKVLAWNRALELLSGVSAEDIIGKGDHEYSIWLYGKRRPVLIDLVLNPDEDAGRLDYTGIRWEGHAVTAQTEISRHGEKHKTTLSLVASPLIDPQGKVTGAIESMRDITRIKEAEAELARINQNLEEIVRDRTRALEEEIAQRMQAEKNVQDALSYTRSVIEANPDLMVVLDRSGTVLDVNATAESLTGVPREQLIGTQYLGYLMDDGSHRDMFLRLLESGKLENTIEVQRIDGHITPMSVNATVVAGSAGTGLRIIVAAHDITRQKEDEEAIRASLDEKVILLREVHHRVKNNLQIIISLVNLQMRQTSDPVVKQIMAETQNRVRAMSLVHEKLYRSESLSRIDFADYTRFLATQLFSFYGTDTRRVKLDMAMGKIMVDINTAVPLGLLLNELISNALKHAFPEGKEGTIGVSGVEEGDLITLVVRDDGIGIPEELDWKNTTSLGMRLVTSLIDQVDGTITLDRENGTVFAITVKRPPSVGGER